MRFAPRFRPLVAGLALVLGLGATLAPAFAADRLSEIKQRGTLQIGLEGTYPPFNYQDEKGNLVGFEVDIATALAGKLGVKAEFQPTKWDGILAALDVGRFDLIANQVTVTDERKAKFDFTQPYTVSGIQIITRKENLGKIAKPEDFAGRKIGVVLGTNYEQWLRANAPKADVRTYDDDPTRNQDLRVGRIDAVINDRLIVPNLLKQYGGDLVASGEPFAKQLQAIAIRKGNPAFLAALDQAFDSLRKEGTLAKISEKWFGADVTK